MSIAFVLAPFARDPHPASRRARRALFSCVVLCACTAETPVKTEEVVVPEIAFADVSRAQWDSLATRHLLFGHQSVGANILEGVGELLAERPDLRLVVRESSEPSPNASGSAAGLHHLRIGVNGDPASKLRAFAGAVDSRGPDVAMMKFCYLDLEGAQDPDSIFAEYSSTVAALRARRPGLRLVHVTMPLTDDGTWKERLVKLAKGRRSKRALNAQRERFNSLMRQAYAGVEPLFDLARIESTNADGTRSTVAHRGADVPFLAAAWDADGGHLNARGRRMVAERFLALLATH